MSNEDLKRLARRVITNYDAGMSGGDDKQFQALIDLGDQAQAIVDLCNVPLVDETAFRKLRRVASRLYDGTAMTYDERRDLAFVIDQVAGLLCLGERAIVPDKVEGRATVTYAVTSDSGYQAEATVYNVTPERYGHMVGALHGTLELVTPEIKEALARLEGLEK